MSIALTFCCTCRIISVKNDYRLRDFIEELSTMVTYKALNVFSLSHGDWRGKRGLGKLFFRTCLRFNVHFLFI